jgi:hypothetical protein
MASATITKKSFTDKTTRPWKKGRKTQRWNWISGKNKSAAEYQTLSSSTQLLGITVSDYTISTKQYLCVCVCLSLSLSMIP